MAVLNFNGYKVVHAEYTRNDLFSSSEDQGIDLTNKIKADLKYDDTSAEIQLSVSIGSLDEKNQPFKVDITTLGFFNYNAEEDEKKLGIETLLKVNGTAILYPYVRSIVSILTNMSNEFPGYNMPTVNIHKTLENQES